MKKTLLFSCIILICSTVAGQTVNSSDALIISESFNKSRNTGISAVMVSPLISLADTIAWVVKCEPQGFVIVPAVKSLPPVLAWSSEGDFGDGSVWTTFRPVLLRMIQSLIPSVLNQKKWNDLVEGKGGLFQKWPPEGWSSTGGWLFTNWTQGEPYNNFCPVDGQTGNRSVAGCPATAMAQIVNFHKQVHQTRFSDDDDYYHSFGSGNSYMIDDEWAAFGFPSFGQLNTYLDTLEYHYQHGIDLSYDDMASLTFACGIAAHQVYSSQVSGTYGIEQAIDAYIRFAYEDAVLVYPADTSLNNHLADNMKAALPAHLGLVDPGVTCGHNVVVDGFTTDSLYHFNFGWGGSANGWYTMPPEEIPYNLTVIEGVVMDINLSGPPAGTHEQEKNSSTFMTYHSAKEEIIINGMEPGENYIFILTDISGKILLEKNLKQAENAIDISFLKGGFYIAGLSSGTALSFIKK